MLTCLTWGTQFPISLRNPNWGPKCPEISRISNVKTCSRRYPTLRNDPSAPAYSGLVAVGAPAAAAPGAAVKAIGSTAVIGNAQSMELDVPRKTKRGKKKLYEVFFTATDVPGTVTYTFKRKKRVKTVTVPIQDGIAEYRWKTPHKWPRGKTRVTATYVPSAGSPYSAAAVTDRVKVRGR